MSSKIDPSDKQGVIMYDSIISLSLVTDNRDKRHMYYMMRSESLEGNLVIKRCNSNSDIYLIKESLFLIKHLRETTSDGLLAENELEKKRKELGYNSLFTLQHLVSKKFLAKDKNNSGNSYSLNLVSDENLALPFTLKRIVDNKSTESSIHFNQIVYLSVYVKEKSQYYFVNLGDMNVFKALQTQNEIENNLEEDSSLLTLTPGLQNKFFIVNQEHFNESYNAKIFSGDLLNIIFSSMTEGNERCMLAINSPKGKAEIVGSLKEEVKEDINSLTLEAFEMANEIELNRADNMKMDKQNKIEGTYKLVAHTYTKDEHFTHVNTLSFWVIEEDGFSRGKKQMKTPIISGDRVRIKNALLNQYLAVETKVDGSHRFILVDESELTINSFLISNFQISYYAINVEDQHLMDNGKYIIKLLFLDMKELKSRLQSSTIDLNSIYTKMDPMSLIETNEDLIVEECEGEFIFELKKIPILSGNESIYLKSIINLLEAYVERFSRRKIQKYSLIIDRIKKNLHFFSNYLMNLDSSFTDPDLTVNYPVTYRQNLLMSYKILKIINKIINFFTHSTNVLKKNNYSNRAKRDQSGEKSTTLNEQLKDLVKQIFLFLIYLSTNNEEIKKKIFRKMKDLINIGNILFENKTILLFFIFKIIEGSTVLQEALFGKIDEEKVFNLNIFREEEMMLAEKIRVSINLDKIFSYIVYSPKYFYFYKKIMKFDNLSYKKDYINTLMRMNIEDHKGRFLKKILKRCEKLNKLCEAGIREGYVDSIFQGCIKKFFNLLPKFDLYNFLYMKECLLSFLIILSKPERMNKTQPKPHNSTLKSREMSPKKGTGMFKEFKDKETGNLLNLNPMSLNQKNNTTSLIKEPEKEKEVIIELASLENSPAKLTIDQPLINMKTEDNEQVNLFNLFECGEEEKIPIRPQTTRMKKFEKSYKLNNPNNPTLSISENDDISNLNRDKESHNLMEELNNQEEDQSMFKKFFSSIKLEIENKQFTHKIDYFDTKLTYIMSEEISADKYVDIFDFDIDQEIVANLPFKMFSEFFPQESVDQILITESKMTLPNLKIAESKGGVNMSQVKTFFESFNKKLNKLIFYYQFTCYQFFEGLYSVYKMLRNYCINYMTIDKIEEILISIELVRSEVINLITAIGENSKIKNNIIEFYKSIKRNQPSLLTNNFKIEQFSHETSEEDFYNYKYLFKFCKINDKIIFLLEKIKAYIELRDLQKKQNISEEDLFNNNLKNLTEKRNFLLTYYHDIKKEKKRYLAETNFSFYNIKYYILQSRYKFFTKLLCKYDVTKYFDKIIYVKDEQQLGLMKNSSREFKILKENIQKVLGDYRNNIEIQDHYKVSIEIMVNSLKQILKQFKTIYSKKKTKELDKSKKLRDLYTMKTPDPSKGEESNVGYQNSPYSLNEYLIKMFKNEDSTYFRKIGFPDLLKKLIEVLDIFISQKNQNKNNDINLSLDYCYLLLKCFKQLTNNYQNFDRLLQKEYKDYINLILTSLKTVKAYLTIPSVRKSRIIENPNANKKTSETLYLNIIYHSANCFLYLIQSCFVYLIESKKIPFADLKNEMKTIMGSFIDLYENMPERRKVEYHIFYTYLVSRILKILNRDKAYDFYNYEDFYKEIFNYYVIKERINNCIREITGEIKGYNNEEYDKSFVHPTTPGNNLNNNNKSLISENSVNLSQEIIFNENILFLNFLTIYTIYLNELNTVKQSATETNIKSQKIKFDTLLSKISLYLDTSNSSMYENPDEGAARKETALLPSPESSSKFIRTSKKKLTKTFRKNSLMDGMVYFNPNNIKVENVSISGAKTPMRSFHNDFNFEFVLLKSIIFYKVERNSIEVRVDMNDRSYFLYYDSEFIDILLLEKMMVEMNISAKLELIFKKGKSDEDTEFPSLQKITEEKLRFCNILSQAVEIDAYRKILHDEYIKSNMIKILDDLVKYKFSQEDFNNLDVMKYFNYVKLNDMYNDSALAYQNDNDSQSNIKNERNCTLQEKLDQIETKYSKFLPNFQVKLEHLLWNIRYMYQHFDDNVSKIIFKHVFDLLYINTRIMKNKNFVIPQEPKFEKIIQTLIEMFRIDKNKIIVKNSTLFFNCLKAISSMLIILKKEKKGLIIKYADLIKTFFSTTEFIFVHLSGIIEKIVKFMNNSESQKKFSKFNKKVNKLKKMMKFITNIVKFKNMKDLDILTDKMKKFNSEILEKIMRLIKILLKFNNAESNPTIILLIDFLNNFINGPDIENLKLLFNLPNNGFFDLMKYVVDEIDYYNIILININSPHLSNRINTLIEIEYKIMQIFFVFFNIIHNIKSDKVIYQKIRNFYSEELENIKDKLKRIYYITRTEINDKSYLIDDMLLYYVNQDFYTESDLDIKVGKNEKNQEFSGPIQRAKTKATAKTFTRTNTNAYSTHNKKVLEKQSKIKQASSGRNEKFIIKFELILIYYNLYILHREVMLGNYISIVTGKKSSFSEIIELVSSLFIYIFNIVILPLHFFKLIWVKCCFNRRRKRKHTLFDKLYDINEKYKKVDDIEMIEFMKAHITSVELSIDDRIYKVYFPILTKSAQIKQNKANFITLNTNELENFIYHILNNYDYINTIMTENHRVNMMLQIPIIRHLFLDMKLFKNLSLIIALFTNFLILASYSDFYPELLCENAKVARLDCPALFYDYSSNNVNMTKFLFNILGIIQLILTSILFLNFYLRKYRVELSKTVHDHRIEIAKKNYGSKFSDTMMNQEEWYTKLLRNFYEFYVPSFFKSIINIESFFYILAWGFSYAGIYVHNFFYGFMLIEVIVRVAVLKNVILAIYKPRVQILVTLVLFLMFIYYFTLIAVYFFDDQFPNANDTQNMGNAIMRMLDQTFKPDGGVGGYLKQTLAKNYDRNSANSYEGARFWYDNIFNFLILILVFQMFLSIIKDYFSRQREEQQKFDITVQKICLICGIEREKLEKIYSNHKNAFDIHINHDHNIYDYICYLNYLQNKTKRDKIIEASVWHLHLNKYYFFLPKDNCFKLREKKMINNF